MPRNVKLEVVDFDIPTENIREAILFAFAHGWRPPEADAHFSNDEAVTEPFIPITVST